MNNLQQQQKKILTYKQNKRRSKLVNFSGKSLTGLTTVGAFFAYESYIDWSNFKQDLENFMVFNEGSMELNLAIAFPMLIGGIVYLFVMRRKNREFFKDKASLGLLIAIFITYLLYSVAEVLLFSLIGAFSGVFVDEFALSPLAKKYQSKAEESLDYEKEYNKEQIRIAARTKAGRDLNGSV